MFRDDSASFSARLRQAIKVGVVVIYSEPKLACMMAPAGYRDLTGEEWLGILRAAGEAGRELEELGYDVLY